MSQTSTLPASWLKLARALRLEVAHLTTFETSSRPELTSMWVVLLWLWLLVVSCLLLGLEITWLEITLGRKVYISLLCNTGCHTLSGWVYLLT